MPTNDQDQIVVATEHVRLVRAELGRHLEDGEELNDRLGLTLLTLADPAAALVVLAGAQAELIPADDVAGGILGSLRALFGHRFGGWTPTMGRNRTLNGVQFKPYSSGGGLDTPLPASAPSSGNWIGPAPYGQEPVGVGLFDTQFVAHRALTGHITLGAGADAGPADAAHPRSWWQGHALFIAGLILAQASTAQLDVRTALTKVQGTDPAVEWTMPLWDFALRLGDYQAAGVKVLNLSVGVSTQDGDPPLVLVRAIDRLTPDMVVVAAAGNHGTAALPDAVRAARGMPARNAPLFPAALDGVLSGGATVSGSGPGAVPAEFHPKGVGDALAPWIDVMAPGVGVTSTYFGYGDPERVEVPGAQPDDPPVPESFAGWATWSGTSFAAGTVTGLVADHIAGGMPPAEAVAAVRRSHAKP